MRVLFAILLSAFLSVARAGVTKECGESDPISMNGPGKQRAEIPLRWVAGLRLKIKGVDRTCAGALISERAVLTTTSCIPDGFELPPKLPGGADREEIAYQGFNGTWFGEEGEVQVFMMSTEYEYSQMNFVDKIIDVPNRPLRIARLLLAAFFWRRVCIRVGPGMVPEGTKVLVAGWGSSDPKDTYGGRKLHLEEWVWPESPKSACKNSNLDTDVFCVPIQAESSDFCDGDVGSPIMVECGGQWHLIGFVAGRPKIHVRPGCVSRGGVRIAYYLDMSTKQEIAAVLANDAPFDIGMAFGVCHKHSR